jgi:hypothetical protein
MHWFNEPPAWSAADDTLTVTAGAQTDLWRITHYGFIRDNAHGYLQPVSGDFTAEVQVSGQYAAQYDQAGLLVRLDERRWLKCGIEFVDGIQQISAVITREFSDWSVAPLPDNPPTIWMRWPASATRMYRSGRCAPRRTALASRSASPIFAWARPTEPPDRRVDPARCQTAPARRVPQPEATLIAAGRALIDGLERPC